MILSQNAGFVKGERTKRAGFLSRARLKNRAFSDIMESEPGSEGSDPTVWGGYGMKKKNYLIGNAHLDPIWQWRWQEGASEARATFASALARMREYPDFVFTCAGAGIYKWIEETAPDMFREIRERVKEGRWVIVGGMWIQPDCNLPSGESFARQLLYSQRYFLEKFGVRSEIGYNVDSFGHNWNLPQLLKRAGMDAYIFMRPMKHEKTLEQNVFLWEAPDGSRVTCFRIPIAYCNNFDTAEGMEKWFDESCGEQPDYASSMLLYGVGNHGGGPTKKNVELAKSLDRPDRRMIFSGPKAYFDAIREEAGELPVLREDLQHHASGCYAAVSEVKKRNRMDEDALAEAERTAYLAGRLAGMPSVKKEIAGAWENVMFTQFHDSLGGCSTLEAYPDIFAMQAESFFRAEKIANRALQTLSEKIDTTAVPVGKQAVLVFNPAMTAEKTLVVLNRQSDAVRDETGAAVPSQRVFSPTSDCTGRDDTVFLASLPPLGWRLYWTDDGKPGDGSAEYGLSAGEDFLGNEFLRASFDPKTGRIRSIVDKRSGRTVCREGARPAVYDETKHDTWSHALNFFDEKIGEFTEGKLTLLESGPVRACLKSEASWGGSRIEQYFYLSAFDPFLTVKTRIDWHEGHKLLKLEFDSGLTDPEALYEIPYADITRPADGEEEPGLRYFAAVGKEGALVVMNDSKYSYSVKGGTMALTSVRSPLYGDHGQPRKSEHRFTDQGEQEFTYRIEAADGAPDREKLALEAEAFALAPRVIYDYVHEGELPPVYAGVKVEGGGTLAVIKESEDGDGLILRLAERGGKAVRTKIALPADGKEVEIDLKPYEIKTVRLLPDGGMREELLFEKES